MDGQRSHWAERTAPLVAFAVLTLCFIARIYDADIWFHMTIGREIVARGAIPDTEFYVWTTLGEPAKFHEWGFDLLTYATYATSGFWGLALLNALLGAGTVALLVATAIRRGASPAAALSLAGPLALLIEHRVQYRPEVVLFLALGATAYVLERARTDRRWVAIVPAITFALSFFHPSALFVLFVLGCFGFDRLLASRRAGTLVREFRWLAAWAAAAVLVIGLVPYGFEQLTKPIAFAGARLDLAELQPILETTFAPTFIALSAVAIGSFVFERRTSDVLLVAAFGALTWRHVRGLPLFTLWVYPVATMAASRAIARLKSRRGAYALGVASLAVVTFTFVSSTKWGVGIPEAWLPEQSAEYLRAHPPTGRLLNSMRPGGFLAWKLAPEQLVSEDGHFFAHNNAHRTSEELFNLPPGGLAALDSRGVTAVAVPGVFAPSGSVAPLIAALVASPEWQLVVDEPAGLLFVHGEHAGALDKKHAWSNVKRAAEVVLASYGSQRAPRALLAHGIAAFRLHDVASAATDIGKYASLVPSDAESAQLAALLAAYERGDPAAVAEVQALYAAGE